ncbi:ankyrin-1-like [Littorina saxatilis]|uniref:ankyrin-1-like n=1 Tax=Littorina saxatilis TaxID=31220 RepID=UPI0038B59BF5
MMLTTRGVVLDVDAEQSPLHAACAAGSLQDVQSALQEGDKAVNSFFDGLTPLHTAVLSRSPQSHEIVSVLMENGADLNGQTRGDEDTALHLVVENGDFPRDFAIVIMFLENNVDLSVRNRKLRTPYDCAMGKGHFELASTLDGSMPPEQARRFYIEKIGEKYGPYITAAVLRSDANMLEENITLGGNPNMLNKHGAGAIHYAITHCNLPVMDVLQSLLEADADVNLRDDEGDTALNLAIKSRKLRESGDMISVVTVLVNNGADPTVKDIDGKDAFMMAEERGYDDVLEVLNGPRQIPQPTPREPEVEPEPEPEQPVPEEKGEELPDPNAPNAEGLYPLHVATQREDPMERHDLVESLTARGAKVSQVTEEEGNTALHMCAQRDLGDTAQQLLGHHIDYTVKNKDGKTAYDIAEELGHTSVTSAIEAKAKVVQDKWKKGKKAGFCVIL